MSVTFRFLENCYNSEISSKSIWLKGKIEFVENSGKSILPRAPLDSSPQASTFPSVPHLRRRNLHPITSKARKKWDGKIKCIQSQPQSKSSAVLNKTKSTFSHFQVIKRGNGCQIHAISLNERYTRLYHDFAIEVKNLGRLCSIHTQKAVSMVGPKCRPSWPFKADLWCQTM